MEPNDLQLLGLTRDEARVYLALLELGGSYVSAIAKKAKVHRVNCYKILDSLAEKGLVSSVTRNNVKHYRIEDPETLVRIQREKTKHAEKLLPELLSITNALAYKPKIQYYEGLEGIKNILEDTLTTRDEMLCYTDLSQVAGVFTEDFIRDYIQRKVDAGIKSRMLSPYSDDALKYLDTYYPNDFDRNLVEILYINPNQFQFEYNVDIYEDKVALVSLNPNEQIGFIIQSALYAKTQRAMFQLAWLGATSFVAR